MGPLIGKRTPSKVRMLGSFCLLARAPQSAEGIEQEQQQFQQQRPTLREAIAEAAAPGISTPWVIHLSACTAAAARSPAMATAAYVNANLFRIHACRVPTLEELLLQLLLSFDRCSANKKSNKIRHYSRGKIHEKGVFCKSRHLF